MGDVQEGPQAETEAQLERGALHCSRSSMGRREGRGGASHAGGSVPADVPRHPRRQEGAADHAAR